MKKCCNLITMIHLSSPIFLDTINTQIYLLLLHVLDQIGRLGITDNFAKIPILNFKEVFHILTSKKMKFLLGFALKSYQA